MKPRTYKVSSNITGWFRGKKKHNNNTIPQQRVAAFCRKCVVLLGL